MSDVWIQQFKLPTTKDHRAFTNLIEQHLMNNARLIRAKEYDIWNVIPPFFYYGYVLELKRNIDISLVWIKSVTIKCIYRAQSPLQWRHNGYDDVSNHQHHHCLLNLLYRRRSKKTSKLRVTGLCAGNSPETGDTSYLLLFTSPANQYHDDAIQWKHFPRYWPFVRGIHRWIPRTKASDSELWCFLSSAPE